MSVRFVREAMSVVSEMASDEVAGAPRTPFSAAKAARIATMAILEAMVLAVRSCDLYGCQQKGTG